MVADDFLALIASTLTGCLIVGFNAAYVAKQRRAKRERREGEVAA